MLLKAVEVGEDVSVVTVWQLSGTCISIALEERRFEKPTCRRGGSSCENTSVGFRMVNLQEIRLHVCVECFPSLQGTGDPREAQASQYKIKVCIIFCQMNLYNSPLL